jgi:hypothetical protein
LRRKTNAELKKKYGISQSNNVNQVDGNLTYIDRAKERREKETATSKKTHEKNVGQKLMEKMGWKGEGHGLGSKNQGITEPVIKVYLSKLIYPIMIFIIFI